MSKTAADEPKEGLVGPAAVLVSILSSLSLATQPFDGIAVQVAMVFPLRDSQIFKIAFLSFAFQVVA